MPSLVPSADKNTEHFQTGDSVSPLRQQQQDTVTMEKTECVDVACDISANTSDNESVRTIIG